MKLKHFFLPSRKNKYHPHILRTSGLFVVMMIFALIPPLYNVTTVGRPQVLGYAMNVNTTDLFAISNQQRVAGGLAPLTLNSQLVSAANAKASHMFANNYWAHVAPDGSTPWTFINSSGYNYTSAGENLAKDFNTSSGVVAGWMGSASHRDNLMSSSFQDVGYAVVNGTLLGSQTTLVVAMYGVASTPPAAVAAPVAQQQPTQNTQQSTQTQSSQNNTVATTNNTSTQTQQNIETEKPAEITEQTTTSSEKVIKNQTTVSAAEQKTSGKVEGAFITAPIKVYNSFNWGQKVSLLLLATMILLFIMKHTLIWRHQKRGLRHIWMRAHPIGQAMVLGITVLVTVINGVGVVL